jgi:AsmA protein
MRKRAKWAAGAGLVAIIAAGFIPLRFWSDALKTELAEQVARTAAIEVETEGAATLNILPYPRITYSNVRIGHPDGMLTVRARRVSADLKIWPLLTGRVEFAGLHLNRPAIVLDMAASPADRSAAIRSAIEAPSASQEARTADQTPLGAIRITEGALRLRSRDEVVAYVGSVNGAVKWPQLGSTATLSGYGVWRGERVDLEALLAKPAEVMRGERSPLTVKLASKVLNVSLDGSLAGGARWQLDARVASGSERFTQFLTLIDAHLPLPGRHARFALSGQIRATPTIATMSDLRLSLDANAFEGSLTVLAGEKRPKISGTLATRSYELRGSETGLPTMRRDRQWSRETIAPGRLDLFDADLRLSAARVGIGRMTLTETGFVVSLDDGRLSITTAAAEAYGGALRGRWTFDAQAETPEVEAVGSFKNINISAFLRGMGHANIASGVASGEYSLRSAGANAHAVMQNVSGAVSASIKSPEIIGVDLERALRRTERRPLSIPAEVRSGQTTFLAAEIEARLSDGVMRFERATANGHGADVSIGGDVSLADRTVRLEVAARQPRVAKQASDAREAPSLLLTLEGPWEDPALSIDPESLIKRSEAAAPLLLRRTQAREPAREPAIEATESVQTGEPAKPQDR